MPSWVESYYEGNPEVVKLPVIARSRYSLHLRRAGRRRLALVTGAPMHYFAPASREWLPIDTCLRPLGDGRFHLRFALGEHHLREDAAQFVVVPTDDTQGVLLFEGRWSLQETGATAEISGP